LAKLSRSGGNRVNPRQPVGAVPIHRPGVNRTHKSAFLVIGLALPAAASGAFAPKGSACFASGSATYRVAAGTTTPAYGSMTPADLRMRLVDRPGLRTSCWWTISAS